MDDKEYSNIYAIPANYTDSGKILGGMLETRNAIEALFLLAAVGYPILFLIPMTATVRIVVATVTLIPLGVWQRWELTEIRCCNMPAIC